MNAKEISEWIDQHYRDNPSHGAGCACLDQMIREIRELLRPLVPTNEMWRSASDDRRRVMRAKEYVLHIGSGRR